MKTRYGKAIQSLTERSIVSSKGILVKSDSMSKLVIVKLDS